MSTNGGYLGWRSGSPDTISGSYVKTVSADGGHLGWRSGSLDIILEVDHLRTIHAMFALNWLIGFRGEKN